MTASFDCTPSANPEFSNEIKSAKEGGKDRFVCKASGTRHSIGIDSHGNAYSWGRSNALGQLGRDTNNGSATKKPAPVDLPGKAAKRAYVSQGSGSDSGHSAILDDSGMLWMTGCDRWQQLGLGSAKGGSAGYTWQGGKLWRENFVPSFYVLDLMKENRSDSGIRDVALGGDHTLVLSDDRRSVYGFGKGGDGQLGLVGKPFVSAPVKSRFLSSDRGDIAAVCAVKACSFTLDRKGSISQQAGRCRSVIKEELDRCLARAKHEGLV
jgi:alpha-tubulin suppressor-like RCC1 family protein